MKILISLKKYIKYRRKLKEIENFMINAISNKCFSVADKYNAKYNRIKKVWCLI